MKLLGFLAAAGPLASALAQAPQKPPGRKPLIEEVRATGCVRIARDGCVLLKTLDGKTTYTFQIAPKPDEGIVITIQGAAHKGTSECKQGIAIDVTDWEETGEMCTE
ncbi:MAG TPA: hypothetical protein VGS58_09615 [Candidatus Sulfopaludibacter sp.]|nr:hypothetical protein [Candidatus Sulfopaludibacter sp.]